MCDVVVSVLITEPSDLTAAIVDSENVDCRGNSTGSATVAASGGTPTAAGAYTYAWSTTPAQATATASGLAAGTYT